MITTSPRTWSRSRWRGIGATGVAVRSADARAYDRWSLVNLNIDRMRRRRITEVDDGPIEVLERHELKACGIRVDCEVR